MKTRMRSIFILLFLMIFLFISSTHTAQAASCTWTGGSGDWNDGTKWDCGDVPGPGDEAVINNGTVTMTADAVVGELTLSGGTLTGSFNLTAGTINWSGGTMSGSGTTTATSAVDFTDTAGISLSDRTFNNAGVATWTKTNYLGMNAAAIFNNQAGATFIIQTSGEYVVRSQGTFNNYGTITKTSAGNTTIWAGFNNSATGTVNIETEMLELLNTASATVSGAFHVASGASLRLSGTNNLSGEVTFSGTGTVDIVSSVNLDGTFSFTGTTNIISGILSLGTGSTATTTILNMSGGTLTGTGDLIADTINWGSGTMSGSGTTTATSAVDFTGTAGISLSDRTFNNPGVATWTKTNYMAMNAAAIFNNQAGATFNIQTSGEYVVRSQGTFNNYGTITKTSAGNTTIWAGFNNSATGIVNIETEMLGLLNTASATVSGAFHVASGASLRLSGTNNLSGEVTFSGTGTVEMVSNVNLSGTYTFTGTTLLTSGAFGLDEGSTASTDILNMAGGTLTGAGDLTAGTINWSGGTMSGSGSTTATSAVNFTSTAQINLYDRTFNNSGVASWMRTNYMAMNAAAIFNNQAGATFNIQTSGEYVVRSQGTFNNYGTLNLTTGNIWVTTFRQEAGGITNLAIQGTTPATDYSQLNATDFYLTGPFNISFTGGYTPQLSDHFILLWYSNSRIGDFSSVNIPPMPDIYWYLLYKSNTLHLWAGKQYFTPVIIK
jgi:hypothetical protein